FYAQFLDQLLSLADAMLTREQVYLIGAWFVLLIGRLFLRKLRHRDLIAVSFLFSVGLYAHVFTSGFFVHAYRILYANVVSAIAVAEVVMAAGTIVGWLAHRVRLSSWGGINFGLRLLAWVGVLAACYAIAPRGWEALEESRLYGGVPCATRYNPTLD